MAFAATLIRCRNSFGSASKKSPSIVELYPHLRSEIQLIQQDVLGYAPPSYKCMRTGYQFNKKILTGVYIDQYYQEYSIDKIARLVSCCYYCCHLLIDATTLNW
jgi:hypothetical protein